MVPRTILYTGKGGVGKTSVAASTARRGAAGRRRPLVMSPDPAHSLAEALEAEVAARPTALGDGLWAQQVEAQAEMERHWSAVQGWLGELLMERGVDRLSAEELTVPPGMDELLALLQLKAAHDKFATACLLVSGRQRTLAQEIEFILVEAALQSEQEPIVAVPGCVNRLLINQHRIHHAAHLNQLLPIPAVAGEARNLPCTDCADLAEADLCDHSLESHALHAASCRATEIIVNHLDL